MLTLPHALYRCVPSVSGSLAREPEGVPRGELLLCVHLGSCLSVLRVSLSKLHTCSANSVGQGTVLLTSNLSVHVYAHVGDTVYSRAIGSLCEWVKNVLVCAHTNCCTHALHARIHYTSATRVRVRVLVCAFVYSRVTRA